MGIGPGKLKGTAATGRVAKKVQDKADRGKRSKADQDNNWDKSIAYNRTDQTEFIKNSNSIATNIKNKGAAVFKIDKKYYTLDTLHYNHLEVFDSTGKHIGSAYPNTGNIIPNSKKNYFINLK